MHGERQAVDRAPPFPFRPLDPHNRPAPLKRYGQELLPLPKTLRRSSLAATDVLSGRIDGDSSLDDGLLATLLFLAGGVTRVAYATDGQPTWFRTSMSAGNLHPVEMYLVRNGVYHYEPLEHALTLLRRPLASTDPGAALLVLTGIPFRTCWKYGERGWRHLWWDAGCILANLLAGADAHGIPCQVAVAFPDAAVTELIGIDGVDEVPLALVQLGPATPDVAAVGAFGPVLAEAEPVAKEVLRFPLVVGAQAGSALLDGQVASWQAAAARCSRSAPRVVDPPHTGGSTERIEDVILRRGSTRVFRVQTPVMELLSWGLAAATRAAPFDATPAGSLLEHYVNVHDIPGLEPGGYRYRGGTSYEGRVRSDDARAYGQRLCLNQPLGGDSAYTAFHAADLESLAAHLGGRSYRATMLEAGLVAGRLALTATALRGGATGLTFYDSLVSRYFRTDAAPLLASAVGLPDTHPAPSGSPGAPLQLRGYGRVMARLASRLPPD